MSTTHIELDLTDAQIVQLREIMDAQPLRLYAPLIIKVTDALPLESAADSQPSADSRRPVPSALEAPGRGFLSKPYRSGDEVVGGFQLRALTPRGAQAVETIDRALSRLLPHGDSSV
jgi:hypothetical protein